MEKNGNCPQKVEGYENVSDFSDMSQGFYTVVLQYQAARREQEDQNIPIQAFITPKQATIHEDHEAPIVASGEGDKEKEKKTVTETVLNNDPLTENKGATEEDQEKQEDRELRQLWLTDLC